MDLVYSMIRKTERMIHHLDVANCSIIVMGVVVIGCICMRGYGSRTNY